jgi:hypothetical protein
MTLSLLDRLAHRGASGPPLQFHGPAQSRAYWEALRQGTTLPARADLDPRGLAGVLDRVFLAERIGRGLAQVGLAGSALTHLAGAELRGLPLSCLFSAESRPGLAETLEEVFAGPAVAEIDLGSDRECQGRACARLVLMPLRDEGGLRQLFGVMGLAEGLRPCKLQILSRRIERLSLPCEVPAPLPEAAAMARRGHLRLVSFSA